MNDVNTEIWIPCLEYCAKHLKQESFYTWLKPTRVVGTNGNVLSVGVPNRFVADWVSEHYSSLIDEALASVTGRAWTHRLEIQSGLHYPDPGNGNGNGERGTPASPIVVDPVSAPNSCQQHPSFHRPASDNRATARLNRRYTFESFVVGDSNQLAHAASMAVAQRPGKTRFNPLCIYGTVGIGKTHLAQAIGNALVDRNPDARVLYVTSEDFTNDFINSLTRNTTAQFTERYRTVDVLLIDDIQFLAGKESTQVQFFHTFNSLHQNGKQIVLTADRAPKDIKGLEERLLSRFHWGLAVDIRPPDFETRMAIIRKKLEGEATYLPDDVLAFIARASDANIRELEGALVRLLAVSSLRGTKITLETAQQVLRDALPSQRKRITIGSISVTVADLFGVTVEQLTSKKRTQEIAAARHVAMYLARTLTNLSLKAIGTAFGGRDHSTVIHAVSVIRRSQKTNLELASIIEQAQASLCGPLSASEQPYAP